MLVEATPLPPLTVGSFVVSYSRGALPQIAADLGAKRTDVQCLHRWNKVLKVRTHSHTLTRTHTLTHIHKHLLNANNLVSPSPHLSATQPGLVKGPWTKEEDKVVYDMVTTHGVGGVKWSVIASALPGRIGKQCRERWFNHLDPSIKKGAAHST